jgi:isoleucyl-tRNA synthetase
MVDFDDNYDPDSLESTVEDYWDSVDAYEKTKEAHADDPTFYFLDGPPYVSGTTHLGTGWNKAVKDQMIRYLRMQGHQVTDRPGYDMHGLPIETKVEEDLDFETKTDIIEFGVEEFIEHCRKFANHYRNEMESDFKSLGVWMDWDNAYKTATTEYIEAAWWALDKINENGLVDPSDRVINWCPRCQTALADAEVEYEDIESPSIYVKFPLVDDSASLVIWTTTPWTIPANQYAAVDADLQYARITATGADGAQELIVGQECVDHVVEAAGLSDVEVVETFPGEQLTGKKYTHPLESHLPKQTELHEEDMVHRVYATDFVTADKTGIVHSAPGHGEEDYEFGKQEGFPVFSPVDDAGTFTDEAGKYAGAEVTQGFDDGTANALVLDDLKANGTLLASGRTAHRYGHCWRCDTNIVLRATDQWFIRITDKQDVLLEQMDESEWYPQWGRDNRFRNWVEGARDWCISRQRYWGIPIPIWVPEDGPREECITIASAEELAERADQDLDPEEADLHRPVVDEVTITEDGRTYHRIDDIFDVWFESGVASLASIGFPGDRQTFEDLWPADLIIEAHDMTRGWFWSQLEVGVAAFDKVPYEEVIMHGFLNDAEGDKMSKSVGNIVEPKDVRERHGVDPTRLYLLSHNPQGEDFNFSWDGVAEAQRRLNIVWNVHKFADQYISIDDVDPTSLSVDDVELEVIDQWILSRMESVTATMTEAIEGYNSHEALTAVIDFLTEDFSRFYIQTIRSRVWEETESPTKQAAYATMARVLTQCARLLAPFTPCIAEAIYQELDGSAETVHMLSWPESDGQLRDAELEAQMETLREVEEAGANARQQGERGRRWPVKRVVVSGSREVVEDIEALAPILADRLNARRIETTTGEWEGVSWRVDPDMSELGPAFGQQAGAIADALSELTREQFRETSTVDVDGESYEVDESMVSFVRETQSHVLSSEFTDGAVFVDTERDDALKAEGYANEIVRRIQQLRKDLDLDIDAMIRTSITVDDEDVDALLAEKMDHIATETRSAELVDSLAEPAASVSEKIYGVSVSIDIEPAE